MAIPTSVKPAIWGVIGGAIAAIVIGFAWGGWVTGGTAQRMEETSAQAAVVQAFLALCVAKADQQPEKFATLKEMHTWGSARSDFVVEAGWVARVSEKYRSAVAKKCAETVVEGME